MHATTKGIIRGAVLAVTFATLTAGAAAAGEWRVNPRRCPDLMEDRWDRRHDDGWADRREDRRDERIVNCPARAWYYVPSRGERYGHYTHARPRDVIMHRDGQRYYRTDRGLVIQLRLG